MSNQSFSIDTPNHFSWQECLWFLDRGFDDCSHTVNNGKVLKALKIENELVLFEVAFENNQLIVNTLAGKNQNYFLLEYVENWFDLKTDLEPFYAKLKKDKNLNFLQEKYTGLRLMGIPNLFEALCWAIIGQQINLTFAYKLKRRLVELYGQKIVYKNHNYWVFPEPSDLIQLDFELLKNQQFSTSKINYIQNIAQAFDQKTIEPTTIGQLPKSEILKQLMAVKGIGLWTAEYALMKSLRVKNALPLGDAGLNKAIQKIHQLPQKPSNDQVLEIFKPFAGFEAYLTLYFWRSLV